MIQEYNALTREAVTDGFWNIDIHTPKLLEVSGKVELFENCSGESERIIRIHEASDVIYRAFSLDASVMKTRFEVVGSAKLKIRVGFFGVQGAPIKSVIETVIMGSGVTADIAILGIAFDGAELDIDGNLTIESGCKEVVGAIHESNIFLGQTGAIRGVPTLKVRSDDVKASHSCTIERLSDEHRFYLEGRGLSEHDAKLTLLDGKIASLYTGLPDEQIESIRSIFLESFEYA